MIKNINKNKKIEINKKYFNYIFKLLYFKYFNKIILIIISLLLLFVYYYKHHNIKVCICTIGKLENKYIREFVIHYKKYNVDKIFLYDNNDINGENFDLILSDYIKIKYVEIINYRGINKRGKQLLMYQDCYQKNNKSYDWLIFYDIDEFINLKNFTNIKVFLNQQKFKNCPLIYLNWVMHTDNDLIFYDNRTLFKRFPTIKFIKNYCIGKSILRGNIKKVQMNSCHSLDSKIIRCNSCGKIQNESGKYCKNPDFQNNFIDHYEFKSTEEYINKINKGDCLFGKINRIKYGRIFRYFRFNKKTKEKYNLIFNRTGLNISQISKRY